MRHMNTLLRDLHLSLRVLRKRWQFSSVATLTLALGIGANTAIFSIVDQLLIRKLPVHKPDELVLLHSRGRTDTTDISEHEAYQEYRNVDDVFASVLAFAPIATVELTLGGGAKLAEVQTVSGTYFETLGVRPFLGRLFAATDETGPPIVVLSFNYWKHTFNSDFSVIGKTIPLAGTSYVVVGIAPSGFYGLDVARPPDLFVPFGRAANLRNAIGNYEWVTVVGRLKRGVSASQATFRLQPVFEQIIAQSRVPSVEKQQIMSNLVVTPVPRGISEVRGQLGGRIRLLMGVVAALLLIACCNVINLLFAQGAARKKEIAMQLALGATRWPLVRRFFVENSLIALCGSIAGLFCGKWLEGMIIRFLALGKTQLALSSALDIRLLIFVIFIALLVLLACALIPAISAARSDIARELGFHSATAWGPRARFSIQRTIMVVQVGFSVTLLASTAALVHSLINLQRLNIGFDQKNIIAASLNGNAIGHTSQETASFYRELLENVKALPGVTSAALSATAPFSDRELGINVSVDGYSLRDGESAHAFFNSVTPGYFETLRLPMLQGRDFSPQDDQNSPPVAVINDTMARHFFGNRNPLGGTFRFIEGNRPPLKIIGIVADSKYHSLRENTPDFIYIDRLQHPAASNIRATVDIRVSSGANHLANEALERIIRSLDASVNVTDLRTVQQDIDDTLSDDRAIANLCTAFSVLALTLTGIGLYGVLTLIVSRKTSEIGVRMALGATPVRVMRLVITEGLSVTTIGLLFGLLGGWATISFLKSIIFGIGIVDPMAILAVSALLILVAVVASYLPAVAAVHVDPLIALRQE
jgi:predicted permease